ncbi:helix-turn-helix domain-containing protein [Luxibacter massiliensis]|uniref:helix-turn-helix domain-containing protein n=1 Tax=Luxibacter massiliensis TaxID=2219695 RepID=UPI000F069D6D|nr:AraC family transcriptional regulator [Luxibacter massiliensis]
MQTPKRTYPGEYRTAALPSKSLGESFPFVVKECGYCQERKFIQGKQNSYNEYLLLYTIEGTARYSKTQQTQYIQPDSVVTTACNTVLTFTRVTREWRFYYFIISGSHAKLFYNLIRTQNNIILSNPFTNVLDSFMDLYDIACGRAEKKNETWEYLHMSQLIYSIFTSLYDLTYDINRIKELTPAQENEVNTVLKYISQNYKDDLSIDKICNKIGFSKYYFCKLFKQQMGTTIHQYVNEFRVNKAKELLAYSKLSITSIAGQVGFKTTLTFLRAFEKSVHMTPSEYRDYY